MFQRHRPAVLFVCYALVSLALLSWSADRFVQSLKHVFFYLLNPAGAVVVGPLSQAGAFGRHLADLVRADRRARAAEDRWVRDRLDEKRLATLEEENARLTAAAGLARWPRFEPHPARVWARNSTDWFHNLLVRLSPRAAVRAGDAVVVVADGRVAVLGQVTEPLPDGTARVLLLNDPASSLSAQVTRTGEQGLVEGHGVNRVVLNYLFSDSEIRPGDEVVTSGLGEVFPAGLLVGRVLTVQEATQDSFKRAVLAPAARLNDIRGVLVLARREEAP